MTESTGGNTGTMAQATHVGRPLTQSEVEEWLALRGLTPEQMGGGSIRQHIESLVDCLSDRQLKKTLGWISLALENDGQKGFFSDITCVQIQDEVAQARAKAAEARASKEAAEAAEAEKTPAEADEAAKAAEPGEPAKDALEPPETVAVFDEGGGLADVSQCRAAGREQRLDVVQGPFGLEIEITGVYGGAGLVDGCGARNEVVPAAGCGGDEPPGERRAVLVRFVLERVAKHAPLESALVVRPEGQDVESAPVAARVSTADPGARRYHSRRRAVEQADLGEDGVACPVEGVVPRQDVVEVEPRASNI